MTTSQKPPEYNDSDDDGNVLYYSNGKWICCRWQYLANATNKPFNIQWARTPSWRQRPRPLWEKAREELTKLIELAMDRPGATEEDFSRNALDQALQHLEECYPHKHKHTSLVFEGAKR